jgi:O-antigen/teichoic acid export membrane protein
LLYLRPGLALCFLQAFLGDRPFDNLHDAHVCQRVSCSHRPTLVKSMSATMFRTRWPRRGSATSRATLTMADQCVASASNFAVGIIVARISGPSGLGAFALAYTVWILLTTLHRSMITDPMAIMGDMRGDDKEEFVRRGFAADVTLGLMAAAIVAAVGSALLVVGQHTFGVGLLSVAPWLVMLDLQDYWRWIGFMQGKPKKSLANDLLFNAVQAAGFGVVFLAGLHSVFAVVAAWGLGATVAALYGLRQFSVRPSMRGGAAFLWSRWPTSQWLASERAASWGASQLYLILAGVILGPAALGGLKAAQGLVAGPTTLVINASGSFGLPEATKQLAERGWTGMMRVSRFVTGAGVAASVVCGVAVFVAAPELLKLLYGPEFVQYAACARLFAISVVLSAFNVGPIITLTATRRVRPLFVLQLAKLAFSVAAVSVLAAAYGVTGAAAAYVLTVALSTVAIVALQSRTRRSLEGPTSRSAADAVRRMLMRNTRLLLALSPESRTSQSPRDSTEPHP